MRLPNVSQYAIVDVHRQLQYFTQCI